METIRFKSPNRVLVQAIIASILILAFVLNVTYIIYMSCNNIEASQSSLTSLTALSSLCGVIINYYFGSSESSRNKDEIIKGLKNCPEEYVG